MFGLMGDILFHFRFDGPRTGEGPIAILLAGKGWEYFVLFDPTGGSQFDILDQNGERD